MAEPTPEEVDAEHEAFVDQCMQEKLASMPDMSERRKACQAEWEAAHPAAAFGRTTTPGPSIPIVKP